MKKGLSILAAICIILSGSIVAFAQEKAVTDKVIEQMEGAVAYLTDTAAGYGVDQAVDYYTLVASGVDLSKFNDGFLNDVKKNLEQNNGKIISSYGESLATYGAVIMILDELDKDVNDFYGYDIVKAFSAMDPTAAQASVYYYRVIIPATIYCDEAFAKEVCDAFIRDNYVMGKGMQSYGFYSADNTAYFITALSMYAEEYAEVMADAFKVLESYHIAGGYYCDSVYGTDANADSTALALMAYSSVLFSVDDDALDKYFEKVNAVYNELCGFEGSKTGVFISSYSGEDDAYATKEALMGLEEYYYAAMIQELLDEDDENTPSQIPDKVQPSTETASETDKPTATEKVNTSKKSPSTGVHTGIIAFSIAGLGIAVSALIKKSDIEL